MSHQACHIMEAHGHRTGSHLQLCKASQLASLLVAALFALAWGTASAVGSKPTQGSKDTQCIYDLLPRVYATCTSTNASVGPRDELIRLLQDCIPGDPATSTNGRRKMRLMIPISALSTMVNPITQAYSKLTGIDVQVDAIPIYLWFQQQGSDIMNAARPNMTHEAWVVISSQFMGDGVASGAFRQLTNLAALDTRLNLPDLIPAMRKVGMLYQSEVYGLPITSYALSLFYRKDIFDKYRLPMPRTWKEFIAFGQRYNGTDGLHAFCPPMSLPPFQSMNCFNWPSSFLWALMASYHQTQGPTQGWFMDPDTLDTLVNAASMGEIAELLKGIFDITAPGDESLVRGCPNAPYRFAQGECLITAHQSAAYKVMAHTSRSQEMSKVQGKLGIMPWPGSEVVLDRATNTVVPCDPKRCPYATRYFHPNGSEMWVNVAPYVESSTYHVNANLPQDLSFFTYQVMSYLASTDTSTQIMLVPDSEIGPVRQSQFRQSLWTQAGYNTQDINEYLTGLRGYLDHPNACNPLRLPGNFLLTPLWSALTYGLLDTPVEVLLPAIQKNMTDVLNMIFGGNRTALRLALYDTLNRPLPSPPPPAAKSPPPGFPVTTSSTSKHLSSTVLGLSIGMPVGFVLIAGLAALRYFGLLRSNASKRSHPGAKPETCLCVTDSESSTSLWEELEATVVDIAVKLHNVCIRNLAAEHHGYESVWEGDSFVIAFHTPADALAFAMAVQAALLHLPWPSELLQSTYAKEVWCAPMAPSPKKKPAKQPSILGQQLPQQQLTQQSSLSKGSLFGHFGMRNPTSTGGASSKVHSLPGYTPSVKFGQTHERTSGSTGDLPMSFEAIRESKSTDENRASASPTKSLPMDATYHQPKQSFAALWQAQWKECATSVPGAVLAYRGLRVRLGMHAGVDGSTVVTFNTVMQRYHYTGPVRVVSNGVASAGHGGQILLTTATAELLGPDERGILHQLPSHCKLYHQGHHKLNGVEEDTDILLAVPDAFKCRLALQQAPLRSMIIRSPGVSAAPAPAAGTMEAADSTALLCIQFTGLPSLLAWDKQTTLAAAADAMTCIYEVLQDYGGVICQDGLRKSLLASLASGAAAGQSKSGIEAGRVVISMDPHCHDSWLLPPAQLLGAHVAVEAALALRAELLQLDWSSELLTHELAEPVGLAADGSGAAVGEDGLMMRTCVITYEDQMDKSVRSGMTGMTGTTARSNVRYVPSDSGQSAVRSSIPAADSESIRSNHPPSPLQGSSRLWQPTTEADLMNFTLQAGLGDVSPHSTPTKVETASKADTASSPPNSSGIGKFRAALTKSKTMTSSDGEGFSKQSNIVTQTKAPKGPRKKGVKHDVFDTIGLRGLRCKIAVVSARGAGVEIVTRGSGRVAYTGAPVKRVKKLLETARVGQILVDHTLVSSS